MRFWILILDILIFNSKSNYQESIRFVFNEIIMLFVVYVASVGYLNESFDSDVEFWNILIMWLTVIRLSLFTTMINFSTNHWNKMIFIWIYHIF